MNNLDLSQINEMSHCYDFKYCTIYDLNNAFLIPFFLSFFLRIFMVFLVDTEDESRASITDKTPLIRNDDVRRASKFDEVSNHIGSVIPFQSKS